MLHNTKLTVSPIETPVQLESRMLSKNTAYKYAAIHVHIHYKKYIHLYQKQTL